MQASPEVASSAQHTKYQTEILSLLMDHLLAADVLIGEQAALPIITGGAASNIAPNVCYLAARTVDKLWQGKSRKRGGPVTSETTFHLIISSSCIRTAG